MSVRIEYTEGYRFEGTKLTFVSDAEPAVYKGGQKQRRALVKCDCGNTKVILVNSIRSLATVSCGCVETESKITRNTTHGKSKSREYKIYGDMLARCNNENNTVYDYYGGRGISVCSRWTGAGGFENFYSDMGEIPKGLSIDRIDRDGDYSPENCRITNQSEQNYNKRRSKKNRSGKTGVYKRKDGKCGYSVYIGFNGKHIHLITTHDYELAVFCREEAEIHYFGYNLNC